MSTRTLLPRRFRTLPEGAVNLTDSWIEKVLECPDGRRDVIVWDAKCPGLGVRVYASGVKAFVIQYRNADRRTRRMVLQTKPGALEIKEARRKARAILKRVEDGEDPSAERHEDHLEAPTFGDVLDRYVREVLPTKKPQTRATYRGLIARRLRPALGRRRVDSITTADILKLREEWSGTPVQSNRALSLLATILTLAETWGYRPEGTNPASRRRVPRAKETRRHRPLSELEARRLGNALTALEGRYPASVAAIRVMCLVGCRPSEALGLTWPQVDLDAGIARLLDSKVGRRVLFLPGAAVALLRALPRAPGNLYLFPSPRRPGLPLADVERCWEAARKLAGLDDGVRPRLYDAGRHSYGDAAVEAGVSDSVLGSLLGHADTATTRIYREVRADPARRAAELIGARVAASMGLVNADAGEEPAAASTGTSASK